MDDTTPYQSIWQTLGLGETLGGDQSDGFSLGETIGPEATDWQETVRELLPVLSVDDIAAAGELDASAQFRIRQVLGQGGMGVVHLATQRALGRDVALKTVLHGRQDSAVQQALLQEARVMGLVEHPNVVPVHIIGRDGEDRPLIVMKRVEGRSWEAVLASSTSTERLTGTTGEASLDFHLDVLERAALALAFAHSRGILHRDIKPANVMIGSFGETYLLDWGLAIGMPEFDLPAVPRLEDATQIVGTPAYIAPEMTTGQPERLGPHTDVYLLGSVLYEVVTGNPPHRGTSLFDVLACSYEGRPRDYPGQVPAELRDICEKAMTRNPELRYQTVALLMEAIAKFRQHRSSHDLTREARLGLEKLRTSTAESEPDEAQCYGLFGAARFGFDQALNVWSSNVDAVDGRRQTLLTMIQFELGRERLAAAEALANEVESLPAELAEELERLRLEVAARAQELDHLRTVYSDYDTNVGIERKLVLLSGLGAGFILAAAAPSIWELDSRTLYVGTAAAFLPLMALLTAVGWRTFFLNRANWVTLSGAWMMFVAACFVRYLADASATPFHSAISFEFVIFSVGSALMAVTLDARIAIPAAAFLLGAIACAAVPGSAFVLFGVFGAIACFGFVAAAKAGLATGVTD